MKHRRKVSAYLPIPSHRFSSVYKENAHRIFAPDRQRTILAWRFLQSEMGLMRRRFLTKQRRILGLPCRTHTMAGLLTSKSLCFAGAASMAAKGSITRWIDLLKVGDALAAQRLWERYFQRLVWLARHKLQGKRPRVADEEDVALSAFDSFCRGAETGRFPELLDRDGLWRLLVVLTNRKAAHLVRDESRQKRGGTAQHPLADEQELQQILSREPTPEFAAQVAEQCQRLLASLGDRELESVALWRMEGYRNAEIAEKLGCTPRTVERKLRIIRGLWEMESAYE
jgi:DNA-directed RNA polymerase specialized sigma24 family protein